MEGKVREKMKIALISKFGRGRRAKPPAVIEKTGRNKKDGCSF